MIPPRFNYMRLIFLINSVCNILSSLFVILVVVEHVADCRVHKVVFVFFIPIELVTLEAGSLRGRHKRCRGQIHVEPWLKVALFLVLKLVLVSIFVKLVPLIL